MVAVVVLLAGFLVWFLMHIFEGKEPQVKLTPVPDYITGIAEFTVQAEDAGRGLKKILVKASQEGRQFKVIEKHFPFEGLSNRNGTHQAAFSFKINPVLMHLAEGGLKLTVEASDYSRRNGGEGNAAAAEHEMIVDTTSPSVRAVSRLHYINEGGTGLVIYRQSSDTVKSGVYVDDLHFPGYPAGDDYSPGSMVCYFAVPPGTDKDVKIYLHAKDRAGNSVRNPFNYLIRPKKFPLKKMTVTDRFLDRVLPRFAYMDFGAADRPVDKFLKINRQLRIENNETCRRTGAESSPEKLWKGSFLRMKNAATMAGYGDKRVYVYKGEEIDRQIHMGVDLASLANAEIQAANSGRVIFAERLGIYGLTVILDHGQGISSLYAHLSSIDTEAGRHVERGEIIGTSGQTGLAGGDHLHFSTMVNGIFVNPIEFWDQHWIKDNIDRKLSLIRPVRR